MYYVYKYKETDDLLLHSLALRIDPLGIRMRKLAGLPDLTHKENSPVQLILDAVLKTPALSGCDIVKIP